MSIKIKRILLLLFIISAGCSQEVEIELSEAPKLLVVNCFFTPDSVWKVEVKRMTGMDESFSESDLFVKDAEVNLFSNDIFSEQLIYTENGNFISSTGNKPEPGKEYHLEILAEGFEKTISAKEKLPEKITFKEIGVTNGLDVSIFHDELAMYGRSAELYHTLHCKLNTKKLPNTFFSITTDSIKEGQYPPIISTNRDLSIFYAPTFLGEVHKNDEEEKVFYSLFRDWETEELLTNRVELTIHSLPESFYLYYAFAESQSNFIQYSKPVQIYTNIKNGAGIFAGYVSSKSFAYLD